MPRLLPSLAPLLLLPPLLLLLPGCASTGGSGGQGQRIRVTLNDYLSDQRFELVSESHTPPLEYYSRPRQDAARKILPDDVMVALAKELSAQDFERYAKAGRAPSRGGELVTRALEIERDGATRSWMIGKGSEANERVSFNACMSTLIQVYSVAQSYQAIENDDGAEIFSDAERGRT